MIEKFITIKARDGRSGWSVVKKAELTSGGLCGVLESGTNDSQETLTIVREPAAGDSGGGA
jgi:hypothetical protein